MPDLTDDNLDDDLSLRQQLGQIISPDQPAPAVQPTGQMVAPQSADPRRQQLTQAIQQAANQPAPTPTPIVDTPAASTPTSNAPATPAPGQQGARDILAQLGPAPKFDQSQYQALQDRRAKDATPINPLQQQYKEGTGGKILRGVRAWFAGGPSAVLNPATYNAPNRQYGIDAAKQAAAAKQDNEQISNMKTDFDEQNKGFQRNLDMLKDVTTLQNHEETNDMREKYLDARDKYLGAQQELAEARAQNVKVQMPKNAEEALAFAASTDDPALKKTYTNLANSMKAMKVSEAQASRPPREGNPVFNAWQSAFKTENKRNPNAKEIADWQGKQAAAQGRFDESSGQKDRAFYQKIADNPLASDEEIKDAQEHLKQPSGPVASAAPPPQVAPPAATPAPAKSAPPPTTHQFSKSAWQKANPKGDANAAAKYAQSKGYTVTQ